MTPPYQTEIAGLLGTLGITAVAAAGAAYVLFRYLGDKWLTGKFDQSLEAFKHSQQRELEHLRFRINTTFDRTLKLHSNEFRTLPELWDKLNEAYSHVSIFTSPMQEYPDLDRMSDPALRHFLAESSLAEYQRDEIHATSERTKLYQSFRFWQSFQKVAVKYRDFNHCFKIKGLFVHPTLKVPIEALSDLMWSALCEKESEERYPDPRKGRWEKSEMFGKEGPAIRDNIGDLIQQRLWSSASVSAADLTQDFDGVPAGK